MAPPHRAKDKVVEVCVDDKLTKWRFSEGRDLREQIAELCADQGVLFDDDENSQALYFDDSEIGTPVIVERVEQLGTNKAVILGPLGDIVEQTLCFIEEGFHDVFEPWIASIGSNAGYVPYVREVVIQGGVRVLVQLLPETLDSDVQDLIISVLASVFSSDLFFGNRKLVEELLDSIDSSESTEFFKILIGKAILYKSARSAESLCASALATFVLEFSPKCVFQAHAACTNNELYDAFATQIDEENDAASLILSYMWHDSQVRDACGLLGVQPRIERAKINREGTTDLYVMKSALMSAAEALRHLKTPQTQSLRVDQRRQQSANVRVNVLEGEIRRLHASMVKMVPFVNLPVPDLNGYLDAVIQNGWESMTYAGNYSPLHLVAERYDEPKLVELFAYLATDIDMKDDHGFTAAHYAKKAKMLSNYDMLRRVRIARKQQVVNVDAPSSVPSDVSDELQVALESVVQNGWNQIEWPNTFSALHLAAMQGSVSAVNFLLAMKGVHPWLTVPDDTGLLPLDYAMASHPNNVALCDLLRPASRPSFRHTAAARISTRQAWAERRSVIESDTRSRTSLGELDKEKLHSLLEQLETFGEEKLLEKLQMPELQGGMNTTEAEASKLIEKVLAYREELEQQRLEREAARLAKIAAQDSVIDTHGSPKSTKKHAGGKGKGPPSPPKGGKGPAPPSAKGGKGPTPPGAKGAKGVKGRGRGGADLAKVAKTLKPLWWNKYALGRHFAEDSPSVWALVSKSVEVLLFNDTAIVDGFVQRFSKIEKEPKNVSLAKQVAKKDVKILRVITDPQLIVGKEAAVKSLLPPEKLVLALQELDEITITVDALRTIVEHAMPKPDQIQRLDELRAQHPGVRMALPETYMFHIGKILAFQPRLECWLFSRTYHDLVDDYTASLTEFIKICKCFFSTPLAKVFAIILGVGNTLNGNSNRGQADGFDLDTLMKLDTIKDNTKIGADVRHFIMGSYLQDASFEGEQMVEDMMPFFLNIRRRLIKDNDGNEKLTKTVRICIEDYNPLVRQFATEFEGKRAQLQMCLQYIDDACDPIRLQLAEQYAQAKRSIDSLLALRDAASRDYERVQAYFHTKMGSHDLLTLFDDFFIPPDVVISQPEHTKKKVLSPLFCSGKRFDLEALKILWGVATEVTPPERVPRGRKKTRPQELPQNWNLSCDSGSRQRMRRHGTLRPKPMARDAVRAQKQSRGTFDETVPCTEVQCGA